MYFINWKSYFQDIQKEEYNLTETENIKLFNTNDLNMPGNYQINYLNKYLGELVMMYYIWKNNLKSDYICISQYRKDMSYINFDRLQNGEIQTWVLWNNNGLFIPVDIAFNDKIDPENILKNKFIEYLDIQKVYDKDKVNILKNNFIYSPLMACLVFAMKWEVYCELCEFIFGYIDYILPDDGWKDIDKLLKLKNDQYKLYLKYNEPPIGWSMYNEKETRYLVWLIERILMTCLSTLYNIFNEPNYIKYDILTYSNNINDISIFYKKNKKINSEKIYCIVDNEYYDKINSFFIKCNYVYPNIKIINNYYSKIVYIYKPYIKLNINEYIDINDLYMIKNMTIDEIRKYIKVMA